jgi:hypothetical protein
VSKFLKRILNDEPGTRKINSGDTVKQFPGTDKQNTGDTQNENVTPRKLESGDKQSELTGIIIPENNLRIPGNKPITGIIIPANDKASPRKSENKGKRGRPATGRTKADIHLRIDPEIWRNTRVLAAKQGMELSQYVEFILGNFVSPHEQLAGINIPLDDRRLITYRTNVTIIDIYRTRTGNLKWTMKDDVAACVFNEVDIRLVELGILQTLGNRQGGGKINSFSYFVPEIKVWLENPMPPEALDGILQIYRTKFPTVN